MTVIAGRVSIIPYCRYKIPDESQKPSKREMKEPRFSRRSESGGDRTEGPTEQQRWEEQQITKGVIKYGSNDKKGEDKEYELLMEDRIDFVLSDLNPGNLGEKKKEVSLLFQLLFYSSFIFYSLNVFFGSSSLFIFFS